jgi:ElaB/YqjD/DUF883 family membrane-anchored ribosome-binding protein
VRRVSHADDPEAVRLREAIAGELAALRQAFTVRSREAAAGSEIAGRIGALLRENPAWAAGAAAGAVAGVIAAVRRRIRRSPEDGPAL